VKDKERERVVKALRIVSLSYSVGFGEGHFVSQFHTEMYKFSQLLISCQGVGISVDRPYQISKIITHLLKIVLLSGIEEMQTCHSLS